jgi:hypothetical protein
MPKYTWSVEINGTPLDDVQGVSISAGRRQLTDTFKAATATVSGRLVASLGTVVIGDTIEIIANDGVRTDLVFYGVVSDVSVNYGMVLNEDTWQIFAEDNLALLGRGLTSSSFSFTAGWTTATAFTNVVTNSGFNAFRTGNPSSSTVSAQTLNLDNPLNVLNQLMNTEQGLIYGDDSTKGIRFQTRESNSGTVAVVFSDGSLSPGVGESTSAFDRVVFDSQADSFFTKVVVEPAGLAAQTAGTDNRTYTLNTYDETTTQASTLASYVLGRLSNDEDSPQELSVSSVGSSFALASLTSFFVVPYFQLVGIILRGVRYNSQILGFTISASPGLSRWTFQLADADVSIPFILDSASLGVLDQNRLGF